MNHEPVEPQISDSHHGVSATCGACSAELALDASRCSVCGAAQLDGSWNECQISYRRRRLHGEFTAVYRGEAPWSVAGCSEQFRWIGRDGEPPRTPATEERLAGLCRALEREGWERDATFAVDPWYRFAFRQAVGSPGSQPAPTPEVPEAGESESQPVLTLVPLEQAAEPVEVPLPEEPVEALPVAREETEHPRELDPEPPKGPSDNAEPDEDVVVGPWFRPSLKPAPAPAALRESELCSRVSAYIAPAG